MVFPRLQEIRKACEYRPTKVLLQPFGGRMPQGATPPARKSPDNSWRCTGSFSQWCYFSPAHFFIRIEMEKVL